MPLIHIVVGLALAQFVFFCFAVGKARGTYKVPAPATTGNEMFERYFRVQMNTLELLVVFVPSIVLFGQYLGSYLATALGVVYLVGRLIYFTSYVKDPKSRSVGYGLSALPVFVLLGGAIFGAIRAAVLTL
ncbi:MAG TPA: MAPEG family protein [Steroidobacteraceae bacterium]|nr:MAPEG family protein [Steroidobacteraceae bacterium]